LPSLVARVVAALLVLHSFPTRRSSDLSLRGFSADCLLFDEAQVLTDETWAAVLPTTSARPNPQLWLTGTPPLDDHDGEVFTRFRDRKSTRLNSSHVSISYAVFCLKKKI